MPELPEVETICRGLRTFLPGKRISGVAIACDKIVGGNPVCFARRVRGRTIRAIVRRGKYIIIELDRGYLLVHLKMTGAFSGRKSSEKPRVEFTLGDGSCLGYYDLRKFGRVEYWKKNPADSLRLGPEPLTPDFTTEYLRSLAKKRKKTRLKDLLLDQSAMAGIGNIYACEALFAAGIHPLARAGSLTARDWSRLHRHIEDILRTAIRCRGTTVRDYLDSRGRAGTYQKRLQVYGREGESCVRCRGPVQRMTTGARSSYFCPACQPLSCVENGR